MKEYQNVYCNEYNEKKDSNICVNNSLIKALIILLNFKYLDLTINESTANYGLRFYTLFNRLDAVGQVMPELRNKFVSLKANINVPNGYDERFDNIDRNTIIPICDLRAIAFVVEDDKVDDLLRELRRNYECTTICDIPCSCNNAILDVLVKCKCNPFFNRNTVYEIGTKAIDRSNNPIRGKIVAYDSQLIWVQGVADDVPPTFYIVPLKDISFICV